MIDISKIKNGVRKLSVSDPIQTISIQFESGDRIWVSAKEITSHTPAPRAFKVGDRVTWGKGDCVYEFIDSRDSVNVLWNKEFGYRLISGDLRHADEETS